MCQDSRIKPNTKTEERDWQYLEMFREIKLKFGQIYHFYDFRTLPFILPWERRNDKQCKNNERELLDHDWDTQPDRIEINREQMGFRFLLGEFDLIFWGWLWPGQGLSPLCSPASDWVESPRSPALCPLSWAGAWTPWSVIWSGVTGYWSYQPRLSCSLCWPGQVLGVCAAPPSGSGDTRHCLLVVTGQ